ncbi:MAG: hypothetical protein LBQ93_10165 [Treponema sp.]|jgi:hypothetical protein|nr:hypothetical protein [Treponema sp.]
MKRLFLPAILLILPVICLAQSFGFEDADEDNSGFPFTLDIGGKVEAGLTLFFHDFKSKKNNEYVSIPDLAKAYASFDINSKYVQVFTAFNLSSRSLEELVNGELKSEYSPLIIDEMWVRGYLNRFSIQAGYVKLRWGRMYSPGPLDIVNPLDYSDLTNLTDSRAMKIARPMLRASYRAGNFSQIEAVFLPNFAPARFDQSGRWAPGEYSNMTSVFSQGVMNRALEKYSQYTSQILMLFPYASAGFSSFSPEFPSTSNIDYFQTGLRFNTVIGPSDLGFQYFYGNYMRPSVSLNGVDNFIDDLMIKNYPPSMPPYTGNPNLLSVHIEYSRYHQFGVDYSQVLFGFTVRAEAAVHITSDLSGSDGNVKNPFLAWSLGFDRDIFTGVNFNVQCNETIRLFNSKVGDNPALDSEAGTDVTSTRLILQVSKNFFRDRLECKFVNICDIEDKGLVLIPSIAWAVNNTRIEMSAGFFTGDEDSELGQYRDNSYVKLKFVYSF